MLLPILLSLCGFMAILVVDWKALQGLGPLGRPLLLLLAAVLLSVALRLAAAQPGDGLGLPAGLAPAGWTLTLAGGVLLFYSVVLEIPLIQRRQARKEGPHTGPILVTTGTYALSRHPGFLWLLLFALGQIILWNHMAGLYFFAWWLLLDLVVILIQDRVLFPRIFPSFAQYQATTPLLLPTSTSIKRALAPHTGEWQ